MRSLLHIEELHDGRRARTRRTDANCMHDDLNTQHKNLNPRMF